MFRETGGIAVQNLLHAWRDMSIERCLPCSRARHDRNSMLESGNWQYGLDRAGKTDLTQADLPKIDNLISRTETCCGLHICLSVRDMNLS